MWSRYAAGPTGGRTTTNVPVVGTRSVTRLAQHGQHDDGEDDDQRDQREQRAEAVVADARLVRGVGDVPAGRSDVGAGGRVAVGAVTAGWCGHRSEAPR